MSTAEEAIVLRLPPRLALKLTAKLDEQEQQRLSSSRPGGGAGAGGSQHQRRRRRPKRAPGVDAKSELASLVEQVWGEEGAPDYDSMDECSGDLLDLVLGEEEEEEEEAEKVKEESATAAPMEVVEVESINYWRVEGKEYIFEYGQEQLHATLVNLPCVVETQKLTSDSLQMFKTGNVGQALVVHDAPASQPRPVDLLSADDFAAAAALNEQASTSTSATTFAHGLTPPMQHIVHRFQRNSALARRRVAGGGMQLSLEDIAQADERMSDVKELVLVKNKKQEAQSSSSAGGGGGAAALPAASLPSTGSKKNARQSTTGLPSSSSAAAATGTGGSTVFYHDEIIDSEPWMDNHPDEVIVVEPGSDGFITSTKLQQRRARENHRRAQDEQNRMGGFLSSAQQQQQQQHNPGSAAAASQFIPTVPTPMEYSSAFHRQHSPPPPPAPTHASHQRSPQVAHGSPTYGASPAAAASSSPYGGGFSSQQSPSYYGGSPAQAASSPSGFAHHAQAGNVLLPQDPLVRVQELRRRIAQAAEESRMLVNPALKMKKEAHIAAMQDELRRLEPGLL